MVALDWLGNADILVEAAHGGCGARGLYAYLPAAAVAVQRCAAISSRPPLQWPSSEPRLRAASASSRALLSSWLAGASASVRHALGGGPTVASEQSLSLLLAALSPPVRPVAPHLLAPAEKRTAIGLVSALTECGLTYGAAGSSLHGPHAARAAKCASSSAGATTGSGYGGWSAAGYGRGGGLEGLAPASGHSASAVCEDPWATGPLPPFLAGLLVLEPPIEPLATFSRVAETSSLGIPAGHVPAHVARRRPLAQATRALLAHEVTLERIRRAAAKVPNPVALGATGHGPGDALPGVEGTPPAGRGRASTSHADKAAERAAAQKTASDAVSAAGTLRPFALAFEALILSPAVCIIFVCLFVCVCVCVFICAGPGPCQGSQRCPGGGSGREWRQPRPGGLLCLHAKAC